MPFVTLTQGPTVLNLDMETFSEAEVERGGDETRSINGSLRGVYRYEKRRFGGMVRPSVNTVAGQIRAMFALGGRAVLTGESVDGGPISVRGYVRDIPYSGARSGSTAHYRDVRLELVEV